MTVAEQERILVIHPGALGDVLQAVPALRALGTGARLTFAGQPRLGRLLAGTGVVEAAWGFDGLGLEALFAPGDIPARLRARLEPFDRAVSWFGARDPGYAERLRSLIAAAIVALPAPDGDGREPVWRYLVSTLAPWGIAAPGSLEPLRAPEAWRTLGRVALAEIGARDDRPLLFVHPGAGGAWKRCPAAFLAGVIRSAANTTACQVLIHRGPADAEAARELITALDSRALTLVEPEVELLAGVLAQSEAFLGGDSGVSHLAAAFGAPAVIFFPAATRDRWAPWSPAARARVIGEAQEESEKALAAALGGKPGRPRP
ncbi:MAG TPA: glycosyltransferase family 9 protein [Methylomirabilota bacterium]|nr:glycosyltransferase family 9 protein [Methylomirabilota bacterium]